MKIRVQLRRTISVLSGSESEAEAFSHKQHRSPVSSKCPRGSSMTTDLENLERQRIQRKLVKEEVTATGKVTVLLTCCFGDVLEEITLSFQVID